VAHLGAVGQVAEAVRLAEPVLTGSLTCDQQPHGIIAKTLQPLWRLEQHDRARWEHRRGVHLLREGRHAYTYADHLLFCTRTAQPRQGLELYERWVLDAVGNLDPARLLRFVTASARVLTDLARQGEGDLPVCPESPAEANDDLPGDLADLIGPGVVGDLAVRLTERAESLAASFDRRNGTTVVGDGVRRELAGAPDPSSVSIPTTRRRPVTDPVDRCVFHSTMS
jgi:hypothetical protein